MNIIKNDGKYMVYGDSMEVFDTLPIGSYYVNFSKTQGFFLTETPAISIGEDKVYGDTEAKVEKILTRFEARDRSLGVILSGEKGTGKSLFTRVLTQRAMTKGMATIIVNNYIPGIASFIESIEQEVLVLFDEFDKTVGGRGDDAEARQTEFLTLFDGIVQGKRLYTIVCNNIYRLSEYLINRPGRFHYHLIFKNLSEEAIREYMLDKLEIDPKKADAEIGKIIAFSNIMHLTYDHLRAIAEELNFGSTFEEALDILNISNTDMRSVSVLTKLVFDDGTVLEGRHDRLDISGDTETLYFRSPDTRGVAVSINIHTMDIVWENGVGYVYADKFIGIDRDDKYETLKPTRIEIRVNERDYSNMGKFKLGTLV